nr:uncharacterized protein LOC117606756 isoform X2 [Osmia lignaria]
MKTEISWKRRLLRKKLKYTLICVFIAAIIFVIHQLVYFKELNQAIVGKLISGSVRTSNYIVTGKVHSKWNDLSHSKLLRDKQGKTVSLRGTRDQDISKYLPNAQGEFVCFTSKDKIDFFKINDNYCDCPLDGSDEPGTNACNNGVFHCEISTLHFPVKIPSYKVNDGYCDCCDGSDEWDEVILPYSNNVLRKYQSSQAMQHDSDSNRTVWNPSQIFKCPTHYKYAVVILNRPLYWKHDSVLRIWEKAQINVTVDGGTHAWLHYLEEQGIDVFNGKHNEYIPNLITGDMDSCSPLILERLQSIGSRVIETINQDYTDYTKALIQLGQYAQKENINLNGIYVFVDSSGRLDHIIENLNTLHKSDKLIGQYIPIIPVIQIASNSLTWILKPGFHTIIIPKILVQSNSWCGLLPIGAPVNCITTTGLKWNLNRATLQFGGLISSSNTYDDCSEVTINTDSSVVWTMGIEALDEELNCKKCCH